MKVSILADTFCIITYYIPFILLNREFDWPFGRTCTTGIAE